MDAEAKLRYPEEACGLIVAGAKKATFVSCANASTVPTRTFRIDPKQEREIAKQGEIIGVWHSHVEQSFEPSDADRAGCEVTQMPWFISSVRAGSEGSLLVNGPNMVEPDGFEMPLIGRPYIVGTFDCYAIVMDFYKREYGIVLERKPDWFLEHWWMDGHDFFAESFKEQGFVRLIDEEPKPGDCFLLQMNSAKSNHVVIYLGDDIILHHLEGRLSRRDVYGYGYWRKHSTHHLRHQSKC